MTGHPWTGGAMALLVEGARWTPLRWDFDEKAFSRAWQLTLGFTILTVALIWLDGTRFEALQTLFIWSPALVLPLQFVQSYGTRGALPLSAFFYFARRRNLRARSLGLPERDVPVSFGHVTFITALLSSSLGPNAVSPLFLPGLAALIYWAFIAINRQRRVAIFVSLLVISGLAIGGRMGLGRLYRWLDRQEWSGGNERSSPNYSRTSIGRLGELKQSGGILWRIKSVDGFIPSLLHTCIYNSYDKGSWSFLAQPEVRGEGDDFDDLTTVERGGAVYYLASPKADHTAARDELPRFRLRGNASYKTPLPVPGNVASLTGFELDGAIRNAVGTVCVIPKEAVIDGVLLSDPAATPDNPPWRDPKPQPFIPDLKVPSDELAAVRETNEKLGLRDLPLDRKLAIIRSWFRRDFRYTRYLSIPPLSPGSRTARSALSTFLTGKHEGHCEYFASAATLLLREAGVPARYAVGYAVMETDFRRGESVVRGIHSHAWCRVWDESNQLWLDFDPTPPDWLGRESPRLSSWQWLSDAIQRGREDFYLWRNEPGNRLAGGSIIGGLGLIGALIIGRNLWRSRRRADTERTHATAWAGPAPRTPLHDLEKIARKWLGDRPPSRPLGSWLAGLRGHLSSPALLDEALDLHHQLRFDPVERPGKAAQVVRLEELAKQIRASLSGAALRRHRKGLGALSSNPPKLEETPDCTEYTDFE
ncbi:MAG TPA: transglutaminase-like domain-containing protein [Luteolibacter sp.]